VVRERDQPSRSSWPVLLYLLAERGRRELTSPGRILGNHLVPQLEPWPPPMHIVTRA